MCFSTMQNRSQFGCTLLDSGSQRSHIAIQRVCAGFNAHSIAMEQHIAALKEDRIGFKSGEVFCRLVAVPPQYTLSGGACARTVELYR